MWKKIKITNATCQSCQKGDYRVKMFSLMTCRHWTCIDCKPKVKTSGRCPVIICPGRVVQEKQKLDVSLELNEVSEEICIEIAKAKCPTHPGDCHCFFRVNAVSPSFWLTCGYCPSIYEQFGDINIFISRSSLSFCRIKEVYSKFKNVLASNQLKLKCQLEFETFLNNRIEQHWNLTYGDLVEYAHELDIFEDCHYVIMIRDRLTRKMALFLDGTLDKFSLVSANWRLSKLFEVISDYDDDFRLLENNEDPIVADPHAESKENRGQNQFLLSDWPRSEDEASRPDPTTPTFFQTISSSSFQFSKNKACIARRRKINGHKAKVKYQNARGRLSSICQSSKIVTWRYLNMLVNLFPTCASPHLFLRVTDDQDTSCQFWRTCMDAGNLVVFIKSGEFIAGGFAERGWEIIRDSMCMAVFNPSVNDFLFSLTNIKKYPTNRYRSLAQSPLLFDKHPFFLGYDSQGLQVKSCFNEEANTAQVGTCYIDDGLKQNFREDSYLYLGENGTDGKTALFGESQFAIDEYEVFQLI